MREKIAGLKIVKSIMRALCESRTEEVYSKIIPYLEKRDKILDIGAGSCLVTELLLDKGYETTPIDVVNVSASDNIEPVIYDGVNIPFKDRQFDIALLVTVLHHTENPEIVLKEARRVAKRIIVIEDTYNSTFNKYLTFAMDSLVNFEFIGHPHSNRNDEEWKALFNNLELNLINSSEHSFWKYFNWSTYYLDSE